MDKSSPNVFSNTSSVDSAPTAANILNDIKEIQRSLSETKIPTEIRVGDMLCFRKSLERHTASKRRAVARSLDSEILGNLGGIPVRVSSFLPSNRAVIVSGSEITHVIDLDTQ